MPVDLPSTLPPIWTPTGPSLTNLATNPSWETPKVSPIEEVRRNLAYDPRAVQTPLDGKFMFSGRWFGGAATGTTTVGVAGVGPIGGPSTFVRKQWDTITDPNSIQDVSFTIATGNGTAAVPVTPGDVFMLSFWFRTSWQAGGPDNSIFATFYDAAGVVLPGVSAHFEGPNQPFPAPNEWSRISQSIVIPPTAAFMQVWHNFYTNTSPPLVGDTLDATGLLAEKSTALLPYFDGGAPVKFRRNAFPDPNVPPGGSWSPITPAGGAAVLSHETADPHTPGLNYLRDTVTTAAPGTVRIDGYQQTRITGEVTMSLWIRSSASKAFTLNVVANGPGGAYDLIQSPPTAYPENEWARVILTFDVPGDTTHLSFRYIWTEDAANILGFTGDIAEILVENYPVAEDWFDGNHGIPPLAAGWEGTPEFSPSYLGDPDFDFAWVGTPDASESTLTGVAPVNTDQANLARPIQASSWAKSGEFSIRLVPYGPQNTEGWAILAGDPGAGLTGRGITFEPGKTYTALITLRVLTPSAGTNPNQRFLQFVSNNVAGWGGAQYVATPQSPNEPGEYEHRLTFTVPLDAVNGGLRFASGSGDGNDIWLDDFLLVEGTYAGPYFDGNTSDDIGPGYDFAWSGAANASTSIATTLVATPPNPADYLFNPNNPRPRGILTSHRLSTFLFELLNQDDESQGVMDDIMDSSATLTWDVDGKIKGGGSIEVADMGHGFDWLKSRLRVTRFVNGVAWGRGIWVPTLPTAKWASDHRYWTIELHDKLVVLDQDAIAEGYALPEGTNVIDTVRLIIESTGESAGSITASDKVTNSEMFWEAGTTKLTIINNLLDANGYYTLRTGDNGEYITEPYVPPNQRAIRYDFVDGENSIYIDTFEVAQDIFFIPNRVVAIQQGDDETEGMVGVAENVDPDSPYSFPNVGRWIVDVQTGVEAFDQEAIDTYAYSRLVDLSNPSATISIQVAPIPLNIYDAVTFRSEPAGIEGRFVVDRLSEDLTPTGLMKVTLRKIVELVVEQ